MARGDLKRRLNIVHREGNPVHPNLVRTGGLRLNRVRVDVLEQLEAPRAVGSPKHRDLRMISIEPDGGIGPRSAHSVTPDEREAKIRKEGDGRLDITNGDAHVFQRDIHALNDTDPCGAHNGSGAAVLGGIWLFVSPGGPELIPGVSLYAFLGALLAFAGFMLSLRAVAMVFGRGPNRDDP